MFRTTMKERKDGKSTKYSNHAHRNGNGKGYAMETESNLLTTVRELSSDATQSMKRRAAELKESAADYITKGRKQVRALRKSAKLKVKQNPKAALGIAAGVGLLIGACLCRRRK
ncbi:MAG TPA: hypothetical protein VMJ32_04235 [Pirellulales bacterium]|nr:hypothetical protein [Pirellulales bacterium]